MKYSIILMRETKFKDDIYYKLKSGNIVSVNSEGDIYEDRIEVFSAFKTLTERNDILKHMPDGTYHFYVAGFDEEYKNVTKLMEFVKYK